MTGNVRYSFCALGMTQVLFVTDQDQVMIECRAGNDAEFCTTRGMLHARNTSNLHSDFTVGKDRA